MNFEQSIWLYLTPAIVLIAAGMIALSFRHREQLLSQFAANRLLGQLTEKASHTRTVIKALCLLLGLAALGIALARPQYGTEWSQRKARGLDIVFVLDSSKSMLATDIRPTRLDRAKLAVVDLIERLESDRIGLVAFAGRAFLQTPPTLDYSAFRESLDSIGPDTMTSGGSDLGNALKEAEKAFPSENNFKVIVLLTDGEDLGGTAIETARSAAENGIKVYAIGIGTPEGEYLRIRNEQGEEEFIRDSSGQPVRSQLDESTLQEIAQITGGTYSRLSSQSLQALYSSVIAILPRQERDAEMQETPIERFQWAIGAALFFLVLDILIRRRRHATIQAAIVVMTFLALSPQTAKAQEVAETDTAATADTMPAIEDGRVLYNQAYQALTDGDLETAQKLYKRSIAQTNDRQLQRDALYNLGHSTYQSGRKAYEQGDLEAAITQMKEAEALFKSASEIDPQDTTPAEDLEQVETVRKAVEAIKQQQEEQQQQDQQQQDPEENQDESQQDQESSQQDQQNSDQSQSSEQQDQQQGNEEQQSEDQQQGDQSQDQSGQQQDGQDSQPGENSENSDSANSQNGENEGESEQDSQDQPTAGEEAQDQAEDEANASQSEEASTQNPVDDMPQPQPGDEQAGDEDGQAPQPTEGEAAESGAEAGSANGEMLPIEGMSIQDATALLESLQQNEKLLPFIEQSTSRKRSEVRDW